jgi:hypothetical protein
VASLLHLAYVVVPIDNLDDLDLDAVVVQCE